MATNGMTEFLEGEGGPEEINPAAASADPGAGAATPAGEAGDVKPDAGGDAGAAAPAVKVEDPPEELPEDVVGLRAAIVAERAKRNDHKGRADRAEGELIATKAALEEARKAVVAPPATAPTAPVVPPPAIVMPDPREDPEGFRVATQRMMFNERLTVSEAMLRDKVPSADVDEKIAVFKAAADADPRLRAELGRQVHPWKWAYEEAQRIMARNEIGDDPAAFRERVKAELRAELEAEKTGAARPATPAAAPGVVIPRSLATASSAAPRMAAVEAAPEFEEVFDRRKRA